jgi:hypothetical protein
MEDGRREMTLCAFVKVYCSERFGLDKCLASVQDQVERIYVGDGWFPPEAWGGNLDYWRKRYPPGNASSDGTYACTKRFRNVEWIPAPKEPYRDETEKMNAMLKHVPDGWWVLEIDPDERMVGDARTLMMNGIPGPADVVPVLVKDKIGGALFYHRLFRKKLGVTFSTHHSLQYPSGAVIEQYMGSLSDKHYLLHDRVD